MHWKMSILGPLSLLAVGLALMVGVSHAQYPPGEGSLQAESSRTTVEPGGNATLTGDVEDLDELEQGANVPMTFTIVEEPGGPEGDAALGSKTVTKITNAQGIATTNLYVGTTPGVIVIQVEALGLASSVLVVVEGDAAGGSASPPQSGINGITPPSTGSGGLAH